MILFFIFLRVVYWVTVMNKKVVAVVAVGISIVGLIIYTIATWNSVISIAYEIDLNDVPITNTYNETDVGIQCGLVQIKLGQLIDIRGYTVTKESDGVKQLLSPSKKYELVVVGANDTWFVQEIRTTIPNVESLYGFGITDTRKQVKSFIDIPHKKKITFNEDNAQVNLQFISDVLVVIDMRYVDK